MRAIVVCGIPRSGSTLVWQILQEVFPEQDILQTHPADTDRIPDNDSLIVVSIRDPRDVAASLYRVRLSRGGDDVGGMDGLETVLARTKMYFSAAKALMRLASVRILLLRYEHFVHDRQVIYNSILDALGVAVPQKEQKRINAKFSLEANRARASKMEDFTEIGEFKIHGDHIGPVAPGSWMSSLPKWATQRVIDVCTPIAEEWGYESPD